MSHDDHAQVWYELEGRRDLVFILREAFGRVWLPDSGNAVELRIEALLLAKLVFDYQRYIIRTSHLPKDLLLPDTELFYLVKCVVQIANQHPPRPRSDSAQISTLRSLALQAFTSGTRALVLATEYQQHDHAAHLQDLLRAWTTKGVEDEQILERFLVPTVNDLQDNSDRRGSIFLCSHSQSQTRYPDRPHNIRHSIESLKSVMSSASRCIEENCPQKHRSFWEWMDLELILLVASYQLLGCDLQPDEDSKCHHLAHEQQRLLAPDLESFSQDWRRVQHALAPSVTNSPIKQYKLWLRRLQPLPLCNHSSGTRCFLPGDDSTTTPSSETRFRSLAEVLYIRAQTTNKSTRSTQYVLESTRQDIATWLGTPQSAIRSQRSLDLDFRLYVVSCVKAHVFRYEDLHEKLQELQDDIDSGLYNLERGDNEFQIRLRCPLCEHNHPQQMPGLWARKIVPLDRLQYNIQMSEPRIPPARPLPSDPPPSTPPSLPPLQQSSSGGTKRSRLSVGTSVSPSSSGTNMSPALEQSSPLTSRPPAENSQRSSSRVSRLLPGFLTKTRGSSPTSPKPKLKSAISSDGEFVVIYSSQLASCYHFASQTWSTKQIHGVDIQCAAASSQYCALADKISVGTATENWCLRIHHTVSGTEMICPALPKDVKYPIRALVFSRDGSRLAMSTEMNLWFIDTATIATSRWQRVRLPDTTLPSLATETVNTQVLRYTPDGSFLCLATRFRPSGVVMTVIVKDDNHSGPFTPCNPKKSRIDASLTSDHGLTAIACTHNRVSVDYLLCSSTNATSTPKVKICPVRDMSTDHARSRSVASHHARRESGYHYDLHDGKHLFDQKVQNAVALEGPSSHFVVASDQGQLFHVDLEQQQTTTISDSGAIHRPGSKGSYEPVQMAVSGGSLVRIVWLEDATAVVAEVDTNQRFLLNSDSIPLRPFQDG